MATIARMTAKLILDDSEFSKRLDGAQSRIEQTASKVQAAGGKMQSAGTKLGLGITAPLLAAAKVSTDFASDLNESMNKVNVVFGEQATQIQAWSQTSAESFGLSRAEALEAVGTFGNLFSAMEIGQTESLGMSQSLVELAADLASFNNVDPTEALEKLRAGLVGETEPLRTLGVNLSAATIELKAMELGLVNAAVDMDKVNTASLGLEKAQRSAATALREHGASSIEYRSAAQAVQNAENKVAEALDGKVGTLTAAQKAQAAYAIIMEQTALAQGDFARTSDEVANKERILVAQYKDVAAVLGQQLLPYKLQLVNALSQLLTWFTNLSPATQKQIVLFGGIAAAVGPVLIVLGTIVSSVGSVIGAFGGLLGAGGTLVGFFSGSLGSALASLGVAFGGVLVPIKAAAAFLAAPFVAAGSAAVGAITSFFAPIATLLAKFGIVQTILGGVGGALSALLGPVALVVGAIVGLAVVFTGNFENIRSIVTNVMSAIKAVMRGDFDAAKTHATGALNALKASAQQIWENIKAVIKGAMDFVKAVMRGDMQAASDIVKQAMDKVLQFIRDTAQKLGPALKQGVDKLPGIISAASRAIFTALGALATGMMRSLREVDWGSVGTAIVNGVAAGIRNGASAALNAAGEVARNALSAAKQALGISSPSKVAMKEVGAPFAEGFGIGIRRAMAGVTRDVNSSLNSMVSGVSPRPQLQGATSGPISVSIQIDGNADEGSVRRGSRAGVLDALREAGLA